MALQVWENDDAALNEANQVALKEMTQVPVKSRKAGGEGVVHTRTHVKFGSDGESSDEEYDEVAGDNEDAMDVEGAAQGEGKAFDDKLDDLSYLKSKASEWKDSSDDDDEEEEEEEEEAEEEEEEGGGESEGEAGEKQSKKKGHKDAAAGRHPTSGVGARGKVNFDELSEPSEGEEADVGVAGDDEPQEGGSGSNSNAATRWGDDEEGEYEDGYVKRAPFLPEIAVQYLKKRPTNAREHGWALGRCQERT